MKPTLYVTLFLMTVLASACFDETDISSGQAESFIKYYNNYPVFSGVDVKELDQSGYALLGTVETNLGNTKICLIRTDAYGNLVDTARYYGEESNAKAYCLQVLSDGGFGILGSSVNTFTGKLQVYFVRTNSAGDTLWTRRISHTGNVVANYFEVNADGSYILTGYAERSNSITDKQVWIGALDESGDQPFWSPKMYGADKDDEGRHLQILGDGSFVITGTTRSYPTGTLYSHAFVLRVTATGGATVFSPIPSTADEEGNCIRVLDNQNYLVFGTVKSASSTSGSDIRLKKVTLTGGVLTIAWERTYGSNGNDTGQSLVAEGSSLNMLTTMATSGINSAISLIITDSEGNFPAYTTIGIGTQLSGSSFAITSDNGFIITGTNKYSDNSLSATLIKTLSGGKL